EWRGMGVIQGSGLFIRDEYSDFDAEKNIEVQVEETKEHPGCICGEILRGVKTPVECSLFVNICNPENPVGPCMVSSEGTCAAYYKYGAELRTNAKCK
ncbi:hydrogenase formation protein HypD, partial [candidate division WOR-3 bacterium]|nr:hydrogenase formation protein HypD [candidate division WOR-3 bacterium]